MTTPEEGTTPAAAVARDAYWQVPRTDYVPSGRTPEQSTLDDPQHMDAAWTATVDAFNRLAREKAVQQAAEEAARELRERIQQLHDERTAQAQRQDPAGPVPHNAPTASDVPRRAMFGLRRSLRPSTAQHG